MKNIVKKATAILLAVNMQTNLLSAGYAAEVSDVTENEGVTNEAVTTVIYDTDIAAGTKTEITSLPDDKADVTTVPITTADNGEVTWAEQTTAWKEKPTEIQYPAKGTFSVDICLAEADFNTRHIIRGAKCELGKQTGENGYTIIAEWNTTDEPVKHFDNLEYYFENKNSKAEYKVFITEMTETGYYPEKEFTIQYTPIELGYDSHEAMGLLFFDKLPAETQVTQGTPAPVITYHTGTMAQPVTYHSTTTPVYTATEAEDFAVCDKCGKTVPKSQIHNGLLMRKCDECFNENPYMGTTTPRHTETEQVTTTAVHTGTVAPFTTVSPEKTENYDEEPVFTVSAIPEGSGELAIGDINGDNIVDMTDLSDLSLTLLGDKTLTDAQLKSADINDNGEADLSDLARLRQYLSKVITSLR